MEQEGHNFHELVTKNLDKADKVRQQASDIAWFERKKEMTAAHMQLVKTNSIAIKNNAILADKLQLADATIQRQSKRIIEQNKSLKNIEERTAQVKNKLKKSIRLQPKNTSKNMSKMTIICHLTSLGKILQKVS